MHCTAFSKHHSTPTKLGGDPVPSRCRREEARVRQAIRAAVPRRRVRGGTISSTGKERVRLERGDLSRAERADGRAGVVDREWEGPAGREESKESDGERDEEHGNSIPDRVRPDERRRTSPKAEGDQETITGMLLCTPARRRQMVRHRQNC